MNILIGGGTGFIGKSLCKLLRNEGHKITVISRTPGTDRVTWTDIERVGLPQNCQAVVNLAGENILKINPKFWFNKKVYDEYKKAIFESRIGTTKLLTNAISNASNKPSVFVTSSAIGFYKPDLTVEYTEDSPYVKSDNNDNPLGDLCVSWEAAAVSHNLSSMTQVRRVCIRTGLVLGRQGGLIESTYLPFSLGLGGRMGSGKQYLSWIHIDDIVGIFRHALLQPSVSGILNGVAPHPVTNADFTKAFGAVLKRPAFIPMPAFVTRVLFMDRADVVLQGQRVLPCRTVESGYKFKFTDIDSALKNIVH